MVVCILLIIKDGSAYDPVIVPVFKTGGRRVNPSSVGSTPTRFRHFSREVVLDDRHDSARLIELSNSAYSHVINAPIEKVDIAGWLFRLPEAEYRRCCPPDHIACGTTSTEEGIPMSIKVEMIGKTLMIQHFVAEVATASLRRKVSVPMPSHPTATRRAGDLDSKREPDQRANLRICKQCSSLSHRGVHRVHREAQHKFSRLHPTA